MIANPFVDIINQVLPEPQAGLLNGILFGIRANMSKSFYEALITTGTVHIVALSGQNISILANVVSEMTLRFGRKFSILITLISIVAFVFFVGFEPTIIRAAIMASLSLLAVYFGRKDWSLLSLILAAGMMLIINPSWIDNLSFQLSFLATLGIILLSSKSPLKKTKNFIEEIKSDLILNLKTTLSAQIFTIPLIWLIFRRISLISPLVNILIGWVITPIMIIGFGVSFLGLLFLPFAQIFSGFVWVPLTYLIKIVELTAKIPLASVEF